jgi:succinate dehydrogenase / fumarate reductase cytochrome b subunit
MILGLKVNRAITVYRSSIGKKYIMAVTGLIGYGFVLGHMLGNLQMFLGPEKMNHYAVALRQLGPLLTAARLTLLAAVILHIVAAYQLTRMSLESRPVRYQHWEDVGSNYASRTMRWSGPIVLLFIIYHLLDFTFGPTNPNFVPGDVYGNVITSFSVWYISAFYIVAVIALGIHLYHGAWSMFQSVGLTNPKFDPLIRKLTILITIVIILGFVSIPIAVMTGYLS